MGYVTFDVEINDSEVERRVRKLVKDLGWRYTVEHKYELHCDLDDSRIKCQSVYDGLRIGRRFSLNWFSVLVGRVREKIGYNRATKGKQISVHFFCIACKFRGRNNEDGCTYPGKIGQENYQWDATGFVVGCEKGRLEED